MTDSRIYDSRDPRCKTPYGAVSAGTRVTFTLRPPRTGGFSRARLLARFEFRDNEVQELPMPWSGLDGSRDRFTCTLDTGDYLGLVWYSFRLEGLGDRSLELGEYQLTVYDGTQAVPPWFGEGVTYQIFPDRFRRTGVPDPAGMVGGRWVHAGWDEEPEWRPDGRGEIRNRDFFGGSLAGVLEKLDYLKELGVDTLYFCPVFEGAENHRYGTGDYEKIDPMLGTEESFRALCAAAHARGMRVLLDGVFNHQGYVSKYFNGDGSYPAVGASQSQTSPYYRWYHFTHWPDKYDAWWGIYSLPAVNESEPGYMDYIIRAPDSIVRRWLRAGADGWRLDVADELPDDFIHALRAAVRETKPEAVVIGEVWEDGSNKIAYSVRRKHLLGGYLDGLMNYPFRSAVLDWLLGGDARRFQQEMETLRENYPPAAFYSAMNFLGTHDTPRILTLLGADRTPDTKAERAAYRLLPWERAAGSAKLRLAALVLFTFPGSPMIYYGDEAGMEGFEDPLNRGTYPWGREDRDLLAWFTRLGALRNAYPALQSGTISWLYTAGPLLIFARQNGDQRLTTAVNASPDSHTVTLLWEGAGPTDLLTGDTLPCSGGVLHLQLPPWGCRLLL